MTLSHEKKSSNSNTYFTAHILMKSAEVMNISKVFRSRANRHN